MRLVLYLLLPLFIFAGSLDAGENAVGLALRFLKRHQSPDGSWNPVTYVANCTEDGPKCEPGQGGPDDVIAITAQIINCFLNNGHDHKTPGIFKPTMAKALTWLLAQEQADGSFGSTVEVQALVTQALCGAYAMTGDDALKEPAQRAVNRLLALRLPGADGKPLAWGDPKTGIFDTALTTDALWALRGAILARLAFGDGRDRVKIWWDFAWKAANPGWERLTVNDMSTFPARWSAKDGGQGEDVPAGACTAVMLGRKNGDVALRSLVNTILAKYLPTEKALPTNLRALYLNEVATFQYGYEQLEKFSTPSRDILMAQQRKGDGCFYGSWDPQTQTYAGNVRGRLQSTLYAVLTLEVFYITANFEIPASAPPPSEPK